MNYLSLIILCFIIVGCEQKPQVRQYTEVIIEAPQAKMPAMAMMTATPDDDPHAGLDMSKAPMMPTANNALNGKLSWITPKGWVEVSGQGMRLVSFHLENDLQAIDVSIVSLGGMAGGLQANLKRWLGQINVAVSDEELENFIRLSKDNVFDFTQLQKIDDVANKSMIAAMLQLEDATVFLKMNGSIETVSHHKQAFLALLKSIHVK